MAGGVACNLYIYLSYSQEWVRVMVFNTTFNNISVISWRSVLLVGETGVLKNVFYICIMYF